MKYQVVRQVILLGIAGFAPFLFAAEEPAPPTTRAPDSGLSTGEKSFSPDKVSTARTDIPGLSPGLQEIVKMVQAGVGNDVVVSFVENSPTAYFPSADDVIRLNELGVPSSVILALLRNGGRRWDQRMQSVESTKLISMGVPIYSSNAYSLPASTNWNTYAYPEFPVYTFVYPTWWFASQPGFWFGYLWPYYNRGYCPGNSWRYVAPTNGRYPRGSWGYYSRPAGYPNSPWSYTPGPNPGYTARPVRPIVAPGPGSYPPGRSVRGVNVAPVPPESRARGR